MKTETLHTTTKEVLREKFIAIQAYLKKPERSQRSNLISHLIGTRKRINEAQSQQKKRNNKDKSRNK